MDLYADNILDHYRDPRNTGTGEGAQCSRAEKNPACGDTLTVHLWIENDTVTNVEWEGEGCAISQAGMSILSEELIGKSCDDVLALQREDIDALLHVPVGPRRFKCALLCLHTTKNAIRTFKQMEPQGWVETVG